jgi:hypothetical protein
MMAERKSIFDLDVAGFTPKGEGAGPPPEKLDELSEGTKFKSREVPVDAPAIRRQPRLYRSGRNATFSVKTTQATIDLFYQLADKGGLKAGETFERALAALQREMEG